MKPASEERKRALSRVVLVSILAVVIIVGSGIALYFVMTSPQTNNKISLEALSINSSASNITANVNIVKNSSNLIRMGLFINNTFVGSYNFTSAEQCCLRMMNFWNNGTYSYYFTATPYSMPMMSRMGMGVGSGFWMAGRSYMIKIMATFANGATYNATALVTLNQQGMGSMMR